MKLAAKEVHSIGNSKRDIKSTIFSLSCTWNSRGWQAKEGVVTAMAQKTEKIIDIVRKTIYCRDCLKKQKLRDYNEMTPLEYMEWFINITAFLIIYRKHAGVTF